MKTLGLIGYPLSHSFSSKYFSDKFQNEGIKDYEYKNFEIENIDLLKDVIKSNPDLVGFNVTIPYKEQIIPFLDELSNEAETIGAVNTVKVERNGDSVKLIGHNTDAFGFKESLRPVMKGYHHKALILGTGGASKAVHYILKNIGLDVFFVSRNPSGSNSISYDDLNEMAIKNFLLIINTTPLGTYPNTEECPNIPYEFLSDQHLLYDLVYNPETTLFMQKGMDQGAVARNGYAMLVQQAEGAWAFWSK